MEIETLEVFGLVGMLRSIRIPFKKETRSTIEFSLESLTGRYYESTTRGFIDNDDILLLKKLIKSGNEHAKALRLLRVDCEIQMPLYWWAEMDTYEIGVVNGCSESTMHTLKKEKLSFEHFINENISQEQLDIINRTIENESSIEIIKSVLPSGYLQSRVISFSYQTLQRIVKQRQNHRLAQWHVFVDWTKTLPLFTELCLEE